MTAKPTYDDLQGTVEKLCQEIKGHSQREAALWRMQERMTQVIENIPIPTFTIDKDHIVVHYNPAMEKLTGIPADEVVGTRNPWRVFYSQARPTMADRILDGATEKELRARYGHTCRKSAVKEGAYEIERFFPEIGQGGRWLFITAAPLIDSDGNVLGAIETLQDTTERNMAEEARRESNRRTRMLLEFAPYSTLVYNRDMRVTYVNPAFSETFGWTLDELRDKQIPYIPDHLTESTERNLERLFAEKVIHRHETKRLTKDGRLLDVVWRASVFPDAKGDPAGVLVILRDITRFKQMARNNEAMLKISLALPEYPELNELLDYVSGVIKDLLNTEGGLVIMYDEERREFYMPAASHDDSATQQRLKNISFNLNELVSGEVIKTGKPIILNDIPGDSEMQVQRDKKLGYKTRSLLLAPIPSQDRIIGTLCGVNKKEGCFDQPDVELLEMLAGTVALSIENARFSAELKKAYMEVTRMNRVKDKIINHLSHEIKTPLAILRTSVHTLENRLGQLPEERWKPTIDRAGRNIERLLDMQYRIDDIVRDRDYKNRLMQSRLLEAYGDELEALIAEEYGEGPGVGRIRKKFEELHSLKELQVDEIRLSDWIMDRLAVLKPRFAHRAVDVITQVHDAPAIRIPTSVLEKIFDGLVKNAVENTPDEGRIEIRALRDSQGTLLEVTDYGVGITEGHQSQIFDGFFTTRETLQYSSKMPFDFNAGGKGADLLRMKVFAKRYHFSIALKSSRCGHLPSEKDICPGKISNCPYCTEDSGCHRKPATTFALRFEPASLDREAGP
jgi:PAS domain S-box-containing protein